MIRFDTASKVYQRPGQPPVVALDRFSLTIPRGSSVCLLGTSGSGKTTALKMINRLVEPSTGKVTLDEQDLQTLNPVALRRRLGYVVQSSGLFPHRTVLENVSLLAVLEKWDKERIRARAQELLALVQLPIDQFGHRYPHELSGGQRQRIGIARALMLEPEGILLDEPFSALDPITRAELRREFQELRKRLSMTLVMVTHDLQDAFVLADQVVLLNGGKTIQVDTPEQLRENPADDFAREFVAAQCEV